MIETNGVIRDVSGFQCNIDGSGGGDGFDLDRERPGRMRQLRKVRKLLSLEIATAVHEVPEAANELRLHSGPDGDKACL